MRWDINHFSKGLKLRHSGFTGNPILVALEHNGNFPSLRFEWQVEQSHSVLSTLVLPVMHTSSRFLVHLVYLLATHFVTDDRYHNWSQQVHIYSGPQLILLGKVWITSAIFISWLSFATALLHCGYKLCTLRSLSVLYIFVQFFYVIRVFLINACLFNSLNFSTFADLLACWALFSLSLDSLFSLFFLIHFRFWVHLSSFLKAFPIVLFLVTSAH